LHFFFASQMPPSEAGPFFRSSSWFDGLDGSDSSSSAQAVRRRGTAQNETTTNKETSERIEQPPVLMTADLCSPPTLVSFIASMPTPEAIGTPTTALRNDEQNRSPDPRVHPLEGKGRPSSKWRYRRSPWRGSAAVRTACSQGLYARVIGPPTFETLRRADLSR